MINWNVIYLSFGGYLVGVGVERMLPGAEIMPGWAYIGTGLFIFIAGLLTTKNQPL